MTFHFYTLGCKVNQYETQAMERRVLESGHQLAGPDEICDGFIINTCTVTAVSDKKCRNMIRKVRKTNPNAVIGVCGCYAQTKPEEIKALDVDVLAGTADRLAFLDSVMAQAESRQPLVEHWELAQDHRNFETLPAGGLTARTRAMLKVQDGCQNFCTYCIIPYARGPIRSAPLDVAVQQAKELDAQGYKEMVVTGIEISSWGQEWEEKQPLTTLLEALCQAVPKMRIRLGSLEPRTITPEFCEKLSKYPNLCNHFHLSLQSGCDTVLKRMNRKYTTARYLESVNLLRQAFPGCAITTDVIVAFPGETEEEFSQTLAFMEDCAFAQVHVFPYSKREGTVAAKLEGHHHNDTKQERSAMAGALAKVLEQQYLKNLVGTTQAVLLEQPDGDYFTGHCPNYVKVYVKGEHLENTVVSVNLVALHDDGLLGEI